LIVLQYLGSDDLVDGIRGHLVNQVPQLHIGLLRLRGVLVSDRSFHSKLLEELRLGLREISDFFNLVLHQRLVRLERQLNK